jgi:four helix bundle protein
MTYSLTAGFPAEERFGLVSQMRRASVGVVSNIAEGYGRGTTPDYTRFLRVARGSLFELEAQSIVALDLGILRKDDQHALQAGIDSCAKPLSGLIRSLS